MLKKTINFIIIAVCLMLSHGYVCAHQYGMEDKNSVYALLESGRMDNVEALIEKERKNPTNKTQIFRLTSLLEFYRGNYNEAVDAVKQALSIDPGDQDLSNIFLYYRAVRGNANGFIQKESEHFIIRAKDKDIILLDYTIECMERSYEVLGKAFQHYPDNKIIVEIYPDKEQFSLASTLSPETLKRSGAIGICKFHRLMILSPRALLMGYRWMDALSHEFTHMMVNHVSGFNTPLWLHEGIARYHETQWRTGPDEKIEFLSRGARARLMEAVKDDTLIPFKRMHPSLVYLKNQDEVGLAFSEVSSMVSFIISEYGDDAVVRILQGYEKNNQKKNFKKVFGKSESKLEKKWVRHMQALPQDINKGALGEKYVFDTSADEIDEFVGADVRGKVRLGDKFRKMKRYNVALIQYEHALEKEPENPVVLTKLARCLNEMNRHTEMEEKLRIAVAKNPHYPTAYVLLADYLYKEERLSEALPLYKEANAINPFNPYIHKNMGLIYMHIKDNVSAIIEFKAASILLPSDIEISHILNSLNQ